MLNFIGSVFKAATVCAVVIPGIDGLAEFIGKSAGLGVTNINGDLSAAGLGKIPEGFTHTIADIAIGAQKLIGDIAQVSANIGNVIGVNHLAGVQSLTADDFTEKGGIIVKIMQRFFDAIQHAPDVASHALDPNNRGALLVGTGLGVAGIAAIPQLGVELHNGAAGFAQSASKVGQSAITNAQTSAQTFAQMVEKQRATTPHEHSKA
jgi:hypothetical protein